MAITVRKGYENQFDINKMLPGEFAVTTDTHKVYVCMAAGISKELASVEELQSILGASDEAFQAFQELINAMESGTVITGLLTDVNNLKSGEYTISFSEAETRENIETTDTIKVIFGKIKKFFSSLAAVAFSGSYADLENAPNFQTGIDANAEAISELNTKIMNKGSAVYLTQNTELNWTGYTVENINNFKSILFELNDSKGSLTYSIEVPVSLFKTRNTTNITVNTGGNSGVSSYACYNGDTKINIYCNSSEHRVKVYGIY